jgi:predicted oxidoreductase
MKITDEMIDSALHAYHAPEAEWPKDWPNSDLEYCRGRMRSALKAVAPLIAAAERERCAKVADEWTRPGQGKHGNGGPAAAIRALGYV